MPNIVVTIFSALLLLCVAETTHASSGSGAPVTASNAPHPGASVQISVADGKMAGAAGPGFVLMITGWVPNGSISIYMVGPKGDMVTVVPKEHPAPLDATGIATFTIPYAVHGLYPGTWRLVAAGKISGIHIVPVTVPAVAPPDSTHPNYRLYFNPPSIPKSG